jgi:hypothetical protein
MRLSKANVTIRSIEDWRALAPPKRGDRQWKAGRSAMELARAWCGGDEPCAPPDLVRLLSPLLSADHLAIAEGWPEHQIRIDDIPGEPPNIDLALLADGRHGKTAVCIESKADEPFGPDVLTLLTSAVVKIARDEKTGAISRLQRLSAHLLPEWEPGLPHLADIRYQLLTLTAAALALARSKEARTAAVIVHEFAIEGCVDARKQKRNADDLNQFVKRMTRGTEISLPSGTLVGPIRPSSSDQRWGPVSLYIGKVTSSKSCAQD